jgi:hypothetical protein
MKRKGSVKRSKSPVVKKLKNSEQSSTRLKKLASKVLRDKRFSAEAKSLAGSVLTQ